jgi:acetyl esterase/lipase
MDVDIEELLDPEIAAASEVLPSLTWSLETLTANRQIQIMPPVALSDSVARADHVVVDDPRVVVRVHRPAASSGPLPCVYSIHGGGYIMGTYEWDDVRFDRWCPLYSCVGVSVEYRLAPETPYPGPLEDCYAGLRWVHEHAPDLGVDPNQIGVYGGSAGGGLAAALALVARDRREVPLQFQVLDAPMLDDRRITPSSRLSNLPVWPTESNEFGWRCYLGPLYGTDRVPAYAAPARAEDLTGLPPAFVAVGSVDGFRDEDIDYAMRLNQAGVPAELHVYPGAPHGFKRLADTGVARRSVRDLEEWLGVRLAALRDSRESARR